MNSVFPSNIKTEHQYAYLKVRRALEYAAIFMLLPFIVPLCLIITILIKIDTPGPVFFIQERPGINGKFFRIYKFRSMISSPNQTFKLNDKEDKRVTNVGKWLRHFRLDELPQLWNIIRGEMSIIGPRPVPKELYDYYKAKIPNYELRHVILPGITGWAQVSLGYTNTLKGEELKWRYDMEYIKNLGLKMDFRIFKKTILLLLRSPFSHS